MNLGSFRILQPFYRTSWCVGVLNSAIFNSFHNRVEFGTILESLRNFGGGVEHTPPRYATASYDGVRFNSLSSKLTVMPRHTQSQFTAVVSYGYQHNSVHNRIHVCYETNGFRPADDVTPLWGWGGGMQSYCKISTFDTALQPVLDFMLLLLWRIKCGFRYNDYRGHDGFVCRYVVSKQNLNLQLSACGGFEKYFEVWGPDTRKNSFTRL